MVESSIVTNLEFMSRTGRSYIIDYAIGGPGSVEFNFERIWEFKKHAPFFNIADLAFYHVHPEGFDHYSELDINCMKGLLMAFGGVIHFNIVLFNDDDPMKAKSRILGYNYFQSGVEINRSPRLPSSDQLLFLKYMSYGK
jgi:hypothetical protein